MEQENIRIAMQEKEKLALRSDDGDTMTVEQAQNAIRATLERTGHFFLNNAWIAPRIGEVQEFAGLPMRVIRHVSRSEVLEHNCDDIWGKVPEDPDMAFFEVEVAD